MAAGEEWRDADGWWDCRADYTDPNRATAAERPPIEITDRTCVRLLFEVSPSPDRIFVRSLDGIAVEGKPLRLPSIRFEHVALNKINIQVAIVIKIKQRHTAASNLRQVKLPGHAVVMLELEPNLLRDFFK